MKPSISDLCPLRTAERICKNRGIDDIVAELLLNPGDLFGNCQRIGPLFGSKNVVSS
jgi:hypothetical protein